ncbi:MAG TPA: tetratricopeptide repeat protein [Longimicrobiales bacterium]|nr:tetratricopeptide repeat protein [Longimicrobiales bacterium]
MRSLISSRSSRAATAVLALLVSSACATKNDVRDLQTELRRDLQAISARQDSLFSALLATQDATRSSQDLTERELMDTRGEITRLLRSLTQEIQQVKELAGQNQIAIQSLGGRMQNAQPTQTPTTSPTQETEPRDGLLAPGMGGDPDQDYADALELYRGGQLFGAQAAFEDFLSNHAGDELVPLVHFYLGDIHEQNEEFDEAIASFERVGELYPDEPRVADAEYRIGLIHMQRGENEQARRVFQSIINTYGESDDVFHTGIVQNARDRLEEIGG